MPTLSIAIVIPILDDWSALRVLAPQLDAALHKAGCTGVLVAVDDGSRLPPGPPPDMPAGALTCTILRLRRNLGHQRAIVAGLTYVANELNCDATLVMDGDGEDRPDDAARLVEAYRQQPDTIFFARRTRRSEGPIFRTGYALYKFAHRALTGRTVDGGNFTIIPKVHLSSLLHCGEIWQHYAAGILASRLPVATIDTVRGHRIDGLSRMNLTGLVIHGISAIAVFDRIALVRLLAVCGGGMALAAGGIIVAVLLRIFTDKAIPGWATYTTGLLGILFLQLSILGLMLVGMLLQSRQALPIIPLRDAPPLIESARQWAAAEEPVV